MSAAPPSEFVLTAAPPIAKVSYPVGSWQAELIAEIEAEQRAANVGQGGTSVFSVMCGGGPVRWVGPARARRRTR